MASVKVAVRVRPINEREINLQSPCIIQMEGKKTSITNLKIAGSGSGDTGREKIKTFMYDYSYWSYNSQDPHYVSQQQVFEDLGTEVLKNAFEGYNACVFAYGQTGSGKSYTMMGNKPDAIGLIPRICEALFNHIEGDKSEGTSYRTEVSYLEIYNERVRDLLKSRLQHNLRVREHPRDGPYVQNLSKHLVSDYHDIETLMDRGNIHRTTASTNMNDTSSRSHAIFTINFTQARFYNDLPSETTSKVHLVDLAGSERADATGATGQRLKEGANINKSLVTLGNVISALADISSSQSHFGGRKKPQSFIPYRDSVLTWLLKDSLGGNSKTMMIATISPADVNYGESLSTLRYANRAKNIVNQPEVNEDRNVKLIRELRSEISQLRQMLAGDLASAKFPKREAEMVDRLHENEARVKVLTEEWELKWKETKKIMKEQTLALRREGIGIVLDSELPHLIGITDDPLSTGLKLYHLKEGLTSVGRDDAAITPDIALRALDIEKEHCMFKNANGEVKLIPIKKAPCSINGQAIHEATSLTQGCVVLLGKTHMFRFNHPAEAARLRMERKCKSMTDLAQSTENLMSIFNSPGMEIEKLQKEEWERLDEKRRHIEELEEKHRQAEESRLKEQQLREHALKDQTHRLEELRQESEQVKQEAKREQRKIIKEQERLKRQSADFLKQVEDYQKQMEDYLEEKEKFEEEKMLEKEEIEKERQNFEQEREQERQKFEEEKKEMRMKIDHEMERLMEIEKEQKDVAEKAKQDILFEQQKLEEDRKQEKMKLEEAMRRLEAQEQKMKEKAKEAEVDITKRLEILQLERDKELEMIEAERRRLEELQLEQEAAKHSALDSDNTIQKLREDSEKLVQAQEEINKLQHDHLQRIKKQEEEIENKRLDFERQLKQERDNVEKERLALNEKEVKLKQVLELGQYENEEERLEIEKELQEIENEMKRLQLKEDGINLREIENMEMIEAELVAHEEKKLRDQELITEKQNILREMEQKNLLSIQREISEKNRILSDRKNKIEEDENLLKELKVKHEHAITKAMEEKRVLEEERLHLEDLEKQQTIKSEKALAEIDRRKYMLDKETEKEMEKIEEKRKELEQQHEEMTASMKIEQAARRKKVSRKAVSVSTFEDLDQLAKAAEEQDLENMKKVHQEERRNLEQRFRTVQDLEEQTRKAEGELHKKREEFEIQRTKEIERIKHEKYKLKEMEDQERVKELIEDEVKKRLFEEKVQREKQLLAEKDRDRLEQEREIQQLKRAHKRELESLKKKFSSGHNSTSSKSNPYGGLKNRDGIPRETSPPYRKLSEPNVYARPLTEHRRPVENPIVICIPRYMLRGQGRDSHHVFEVQVTVLDNSWVVYRRYRQFRELHELMRHLYPEIGALEFPPKRLFGNKSERVVSKRRGHLENYMRSFIHVCLRIRSCPLSPGDGRILSKHTLCEFAPFFKKGTFETTKYGTS